VKREEILDTAKKYVTQNRNKEYGEPEDNFKTIASFWTTYLAQRHNIEIKIDAVDVAVMQALLKIARLAENPTKDDNWIDGAGYMACGGEIATKVTQLPIELEVQTSGLGNYHVVEMETEHGNIKLHRAKVSFDTTLEEDRFGTIADALKEVTPQ
jgi:hypothetical protein